MNPNSNPPAEVCNVDAVVVGASWAGLWLLHLLEKQGLRVLLIDACEGVGGSWQYTRYPGCTVDTEVPFFEFSDPSLWRQWCWSNRFPDQSEIQQYLSWVCDELNLRQHIRLNTKVTAAHWNESENEWRIWSDSTHVANTQYFLPCTGYATVPYIPSFPGQEDFPNAHHTAQWPPDLKWQGKKVGIIGTAASGVQCIETMAPYVSKLIVFQRSPNLATPKRQMRYTQVMQTRLKTRRPELFAQRRWSRWGYGDMGSRLHERRTLDDSAENRDGNYNKLWLRGGLAFWYDNYSDLLTNPAANRLAYQYWRRKTLPRIRNPQIAEKLAPAKPPHPFGAKRPALETAYFEMFNLLHVNLVDVNEESITKITAKGIETAQRTFDIDLLIYATGYDYFTGSMLKMGIRGTNGQRLEDKWKIGEGEDGVHTQLGLMTAGFPNMMFVIGPQAPSALGITPYMAEIQGKWIAASISHMRAVGKSRIEAERGAELEWKGEVNEMARQTLSGTTESWYNGGNIDGRKKEAMCYYGGVDKYTDILEGNTDSGFPGFSIT